MRSSRIPHVAYRIIFIVLLSSFLEAYDLNQVQIQKLENGLTVMILEDHSLPLVSSQMLYRVGARNECEGTTGLAHFVEHMAYRATKNFPGTDVVSRIYGVGGEWHGYTWIDETTYYETVPKQDLDVVLQIQADRMHNALLKEDEVEAERGAVLTELHSYENDPALVLNDAVVATTFQQHAYRNNTIGWVSDVERITHEDLVNFYHSYYNPSNAVLAIAGDVDCASVLGLVHRNFDAIPSGISDTMPRTIEPPQEGERRLVLHGPASQNYFQITYHFPPATDPDYPAMLLLQAVLTGSPGVNFIQHEDPEEAHSGTRLYGIGDSIGTFQCGSANPYVFTIAGTAPKSDSPDSVEQAIESRIADLRQKDIGSDELDRARKQFLFELTFDIQGTEDAAHQMAYFEGIHAFGVLQQLPQVIQNVTAGDLRRVANKYLQPYQRTIGWYLAGERIPIAQATSAVPIIKPNSSSTGAQPSVFTLPQTTKLKNGLTVIVQKTNHTEGGVLRILVPSNTLENGNANEPVWRYTSFRWKFLGANLSDALAEAQSTFAGELKPAGPAEPSDDPETRLNEMLPRLLGIPPINGEARPILVSLAGDIDPNQATAQVRDRFGRSSVGKRTAAVPFRIQERAETARIPGKAQSQIGYAVPAVAPSDPASYAYRVLLYIMTHGYEGRLGKELINRKGLIYYIGNEYHSDGNTGWISVTMGVDPDKLEETRTQFLALMNQLKENPPTDAEVAEAKQYLIGRRLTANQNNDELTAFAAREWIEQGKILSAAEFNARVNAVTIDQVRKLIPQFLDGVSAVVDTR